MGKTNKKNISRTLLFAIWLVSNTLRTFILANTGKIRETREN